MPLCCDVHTCCRTVESFTVGIRTSRRTKTTVWCPAVPPRCNKYKWAQFTSRASRPGGRHVFEIFLLTCRTVYETRYYTDTRTLDYPYIDCCDGYETFFNICCRKWQFCSVVRVRISDAGVHATVTTNHAVFLLLTAKCSDCDQGFCVAPNVCVAKQVTQRPWDPVMAKFQGHRVYSRVIAIREWRLLVLFRVFIGI